LVIKITIDICSAIDAAWREQIVHRDIKPGNILLRLDRDGSIASAKLGDFGISQDQQESSSTSRQGLGHPGTRLYMAPEQSNSANFLDVRADIYALGVTLWLMLTSVEYKPLLNQTNNPFLQQYNKDASPDIADIIRVAVANDPSHRYPTPERMANDLKEVLAGGHPIPPTLLVSSATSAPPTEISLPLSQPNPPRRSRVLIALLAILLLLGASFFVMSPLLVQPNQSASNTTPPPSTSVSTSEVSIPANVVGPVTAEPTPTNTSVSIATDTPVPTATSTPSPTNTSSPTNTPEPTKTTPTATETPSVSPTPTPMLFSGPIPFASPNDPNTLNPLFGWQPGASPASSYDLKSQPGALRLIAGPGTNQWSRTNSLPLVLLPIKGDFDAQVKVVIHAEQEIQNAGLGVRSALDNTTWIRLERVLYQRQQRVTANAMNKDSPVASNSVSYSNDTVYFRIQRRGSLFTVAYSTNGTNWVNEFEDLVFEMSNEVQIYLFAYSTANVGVVAQFYELVVSNQ
jgi:eukaryotic-like serine/threonine-protein kinase